MKKFLIKLTVFSTLLGVIFVIGIMLPPTPKAKSFVLFSKIQKDSLLEYTITPRIIFIGGSNLLYGLNSQLIKDSLHLNPINTGSIATVGLSYMMDNTLPYIQKGDIVVIAPEYQQFFRTFAFGGSGLLRLLMDVDPSGFQHIKSKQWVNMAKNLPEYFVSKFDPNEYFNVKINPAYDVSIFNEYGDSNAHWILKKQGFDPDNFTDRKLNQDILKEMKQFEREILNRGGHLFLTYPCFQETSYEINKKEIVRIEKELIHRNFRILGSPERYKMADSLMFDTPYHLIKTGVNLRTSLLIKDIKKSGVHKTKQ